MRNPVPENYIKYTKAVLLATWQVLTEELVTKHPKDYVETTNGNQIDSRKNTQSTCLGAPTKEFHEMTTEPKPIKENNFYTKVIQKNGKLFRNQTGSFLVTSSRGYKFIMLMIMYDHDTNIILAE